MPKASNKEVNPFQLPPPKGQSTISFSGKLCPVKRKQEPQSQPIAKKVALLCQRPYITIEKLPATWIAVVEKRGWKRAGVPFFGQVKHDISMYS